MKAIGIIPARWQASRLPGKPLAEITGRPMIRHVYERAQQATRLSEVLVATDDERIMVAVRAFGGHVVLTSPNHRSGTDRVAEAAAGLSADVVVNIQGDEPLIDPHAIDSLVEPFQTRPDVAMTTLAVPIRAPAEIEDPSVVKVVVGRQGYALYFSRFPIPYRREGGAVHSVVPTLKHIGLYAYRSDFLQAFARIEPTPLEQTEALEQLRVLEHGHRIFVVPTEHDAVSVDTPEDLERVRAMMRHHDG
jgi:3-deoxy-manno-octulosonate cytidylyltransferase (CMP-KDO synthetase)